MKHPSIYTYQSNISQITPIQPTSPKLHLSIQHPSNYTYLSNITQITPIYLTSPKLHLSIQHPSNYTYLFNIPQITPIYPTSPKLHLSIQHPSNYTLCVAMIQHSCCQVTRASVIKKGRLFFNSIMSKDFLCLTRCCCLSYG